MTQQNANDAPYTGIWEYEIIIPSDLIDVGDEFHACIDTKKYVILACYELENAPEAARTSSIGFQ